jgi:hypothetical protein
MPFVVNRITTFLLVTLQTYAAGASVPSANEILSAVAHNEELKSRSLQRYIGLRHYTIRNARFHIYGSMTVRLDFQQDRGKAFTVLEQTGSNRVRQKVFEPLLREEAEASHSTLREQMRLSPANYRAKVIGQELQNGRDCWVLALEPKHKSKYLIRGKIWVDVRESEPVQLKGRPARSVSFWVGEPLIDEQFGKVTRFWMPIRMTSRSSGLLGSSELTIDYYKYEFVPVRDISTEGQTIQTR